MNLCVLSFAVIKQSNEQSNHSAFVYIVIFEIQIKNGSNLLKLHIRKWRQNS